MGKKPIVSVTYENESDFNKKLLTLHKLCVTSLLCGPWANLNAKPYFFLNEMNKQDLPAMFSTEFWCLFIVVLFFWLYCVT